MDVNEGVPAIPKKVFVGNLSYDVTREELIQTFSAAGKVLDAKVPTDSETGKPRGFAFVEFEDDTGVQRAVSQLNGQDLKGRPLRVNEAEDRPPRAPGSAPGPRPSFGGPRPGGPRPSFGGGGPGGPPGGTSDFSDFRKPARRVDRGSGDRDKRGAFKPKPPEPRRVERRKPRSGMDEDDDY